MELASQLQLSEVPTSKPEVEPQEKAKAYAAGKRLVASCHQTIIWTDVILMLIVMLWWLSWFDVECQSSSCSSLSLFVRWDTSHTIFMTSCHGKWVWRLAENRGRHHHHFERLSMVDHVVRSLNWKELCLAFLMSTSAPVGVRIRGPITSNKPEYSRRYVLEFYSWQSAFRALDLKFAKVGRRNFCTICTR